MARTITLETRVNHQRFAQGISTMTRDLSKFQRTARGVGSAVGALAFSARNASNAGEAIS